MEMAEGETSAQEVQDTGMAGSSTAPGPHVAGQIHDTDFHQGAFTDCMFYMKDQSGKNAWETRWVIMPVTDEVIPQPPGGAFTGLQTQLKELFLASLVAVWRGSMMLCLEHESRGDAINMIIRHPEVKEVMLHFLQELDTSVRDIRMKVELRELSRPAERTTQEAASSGPRVGEALSPGTTTQESGLLATNGEEETPMSETPRTPDTPATRTPARRDPWADVALLDASRAGNLAEVNQILAAGGADVNCRGRNGWTPVMRAARGGHRDVVEFLVGHGADVSLVDGNRNNTLHLACLSGDVEMVKFVLSLPGVDIDARNNSGQTAADVVRLGGHHPLVDLLESLGAQ